VTSAAMQVILLISGIFELSLLAKATAVLVVGLFVVRLARRRRASVRHFMLMATFAALALLPLFLIAPFRATLRIIPPIPSGAAVLVDGRGWTGRRGCARPAVGVSTSSWRVAASAADG
jgi:hypothetical protein